MASGRRRIGFALLRRGLREGNGLLQAAGVLLILRRVKRRPEAVFDLGPGQKAGVVVGRPGDEPVAFRIDSA